MQREHSLKSMTNIPLIMVIKRSKKEGYDYSTDRRR